MSYPQTGPEVHVTGRRIVATIFDGIVLSIAYQVLTGFLGGRISNVSHLDFTRLRTGGNLGFLIFVLLYFTLLEGLLGRTLGKAVAGIRVIDARTGGRPGLGGALVRTILRPIDGIGGYLLGFIIVLCSSRRRRLGDMAGGTLVVRR